MLFSHEGSFPVKRHDSRHNMSHGSELISMSPAEPQINSLKDISCEHIEPHIEVLA